MAPALVSSAGFLVNEDDRYVRLALYEVVDSRHLRRLDRHPQVLGYATRDAYFFLGFSRWLRADPAAAFEFLLVRPSRKTLDALVATFLLVTLFPLAIGPLLAGVVRSADGLLTIVCRRN